MRTAELHPVARLPEDWASVVAAAGERPFRAKEIFRWIHQRGVTDPAAMSSLPASLRTSPVLAGAPVGRVERVHRSPDDTRKLLVRMADDAPVETVLLPRVSGPGSPAALAGASASEGDPDDDDPDDPDDAEDAEDADGARPKVRVTQCISTQVGCAMGCVFCASGVAGLTRHLGPHEIVGQVLLGRAALDPDEALRGVVYMGMGEPLHNYEATKRSLELLVHPDGVGLSRRRVTVSTSGLVPEIRRLGEDFDGQIGLAVSLHAVTDERRSALMPINRRYPLPELVAALRAYPLPKRRRITIEYTLIAGQNDSIEDASKLVRLLRDLKTKVNLIPMNGIQGSPLGPPDWERVLRFQEVVTSANLSCFIRRQRGDEVSAACGQLALLGGRRKVRTHRTSD
jgi:23S rRNA (adenine2503-C2)-methyltransferase